MGAIRSAINRTARRIRAAVGGSAVILTYHRIIDADVDPHLLAVSPARFAEHVSAFASRYTMMTVGQVLHALAEGRRLPRRAVVLSFDDGYADSLELAAPILTREGVPGTVFVSTCGLRGTREFWWDELEQLLLRNQLPDQLVVPGVDGRELTVQMPEHERPAPAEPFRGWDVTQPAETIRQQLYEGLSAHLREQLPSVRQHVMQSLRDQTSTPTVVRDEKRLLSHEGVQQLHACGVEIGGHTIDHVWLAASPAEEQLRQIVESKSTLEEILGEPIVSFSYPYGSPGSFSAETERLVRDAGFLGAVTTGAGTPPWGTVGLGSNRFALPRMATGDFPADELVRLIDKQLGL